MSNGNRIRLLALAAVIWGMSGGYLPGQLLPRISDAARTRAPEPLQSNPGGQPNSSSKPGDRSADNLNENRESNLFGELLGMLLFGSSGNSGPRSMLHGSSRDIDYEIYSREQTDSVFYASFPYEDRAGGMLNPRIGYHKDLSVRTAFWFGTDFDQLNTWNTALRIDGRDAFGLDGQWAYLTESTVPGKQDWMHLGDINLTVPLIEREHVLVRSGAGLNLLVDRQGTVADYNVTLTTNWFPIQPVNFGFEVDYGELGRAHQLHLLSTTGLNFRHLEMFGGYEYRRIGGVELQGPLFGLRLWW